MWSLIGAVCMLAGSPVEMPWLDQAQALLWSYYAGMEGGTAQVIFGQENPSGRMAETMPAAISCSWGHPAGISARQ